MTTVTLIRHYSGFANVADGFTVMEPGAYIDEFVQTTEDYLLPDEYFVARTALGDLMIFRRDEKRGCEIVEHSSGRPQLVGLAREMPVLKRATAPVAPAA